MNKENKSEAETMLLIEQAFGGMPDDARRRILSWVLNRWGELLSAPMYKPIAIPGQAPAPGNLGDTFQIHNGDGIPFAGYVEPFTQDTAASVDELLSCSEDAAMIMSYLRSGNEKLIEEASNLLKDEYFLARVKRGGYAEDSK